MIILYVTLHNKIGLKISSLLAPGHLGIKVMKVWFAAVESLPHLKKSATAV